MFTQQKAAILTKETRNTGGTKRKLKNWTGNQYIHDVYK